MPSIILAPIKINSNAGEMVFGDVLQVTPKSTSKANSGAGGGINGDFSASFSLLSLTNTLDPDIADSNNTANN
ncbi:spore germination protein [Paenibacillus puerhi]|uniref:spore germination protein n=1 Tax=Paenibacillus puerhi TaxID=2692622 RepID=UPI0013582BFF|nr:spore germination protein [Paenibacillus puerhi]